MPITVEIIEFGEKFEWKKMIVMVMTRRMKMIAGFLMVRVFIDNHCDKY